MITKETAFEIYNCYCQIEEIDRVVREMEKGTECVREEEKEKWQGSKRNDNSENFSLDIQLNALDMPNFPMSAISISPEIAIKAMYEKRRSLVSRLNSLRTIIRMELSESIESPINF